MTDEELFARVKNLSAGELACLRLVSKLCNSKEIARQLKISRHTVDNRLKRAISELQVTNRIEAARTLTLYEERVRQTNGWSNQSQALVGRTEDAARLPPLEGRTHADVDDDDRYLRQSGSETAEVGMAHADGQNTGSSMIQLERVTRSAPRTNDFTGRGNDSARSNGLFGEIRRPQGKPTDIASGVGVSLEHVDAENNNSTAPRVHLSVTYKILVIIASAFALFFLISIAVGTIHTVSDVCRNFIQCR